MLGNHRGEHMEVLISVRTGMGGWPRARPAWGVVVWCGGNRPATCSFGISASRRDLDSQAAL